MQKAMKIINDLNQELKKNNNLQIEILIDKASKFFLDFLKISPYKNYNKIM